MRRTRLDPEKKTKTMSSRVFRRCFVSVMMVIGLLQVSWTTASAEEGSAPSDRLGKKFFFNLADDFKDVVIAPKDWQGPDIFRLAAVFGTGTVLFTLDQDIFKWFEKNRTEAASDFFDFMTRFGDGGVLTGLLAAMYLSGEIAAEPGLRKTALLSLESFITAGLLTTVLKTAVGRARPRAFEGSQSFHPFSTSSTYTSFPSGHSTAAFAVAASIAEQSESRVVDVLAYSLATLVAVARVQKEKHWASDSFIGSAIGFFVAKKIAALDRAREAKSTTLSFQLIPKANGLTLVLAF